MKNKLKEVAWVCDNCARFRGASMPEGHVATYHRGQCGICKQEKNVTEPRDYGRDRKKLKI